MTGQHRIIISILLFAVAPLLHAQTPQVSSMFLPAGDGAWVVRVVTSGGLTGRGGGDFAISSEGKMLCAIEMRCPAAFDAKDLQPLIEILQPASLQVPVFSAVSLCNDCIKNTITISRRDSTGMVQTYTASFDLTTRSALPQEVIQIYDAALALEK